MSSDLITIEDFTCLACGCLCDDVALQVKGGRIVEASRACEPGRVWFLADHGPAGRPSATIEGRAVEPAEAIERAASILTGARSPLVLGLTRTSLEAQASAVAIADRIGASIDPSHSDGALPGLLALQRVGRVSATLGEVRNRADIVLFWGVDPITTHPRHLERYSVEPRGRFLPGGRADRFVAVVDGAENATARIADLALRVDTDRQLAALSALRGLVRGAQLDPSRIEPSIGIPAAGWRELADRLRSARYGAFFFGDGLGRSLGGPACVEAALALVRDLNLHGSGRFVALPIGRPFNAAGAEAVLAWQTSAPLACDFSRGHPRYLPAEASATVRLARGEADAALIVADDTDVSRAGIPTVVVAPDATEPARGATVGLASATTGIHSGGSVLRCDGVSLPLRPALATDLPTDRDLLIAIENRLREDRGK